MRGSPSRNVPERTRHHLPSVTPATPWSSAKERVQLVSPTRRLSEWHTVTPSISLFPPLPILAVSPIQQSLREEDRSRCCSSSPADSEESRPFDGANIHEGWRVLRPQ